MQRFRTILKQIVKKIAPHQLIRRYRELRFDESQIIYNEMSYKDSLEIVLNNQTCNYEGRKMKRFLDDIRKEYIENHFRPDEYYLYDFEHKSEKERREYLSQKGKNKLLYSYYSPNGDRIVWQLQDKYTFYSLLRPFFKRSVVKVRDRNDWGKFAELCHDHSDIICKPLSKGCGVGIWKTIVNTEKQAKEVFEKLIGSGEYIIEELVVQDATIASFNDSSVNTVRFPSFRHGDKTIGAYPFMRFGRKGSVVDNAGQGGLFASVDIVTGQICTCGYDEKGNQFDVHPDSGLKIKDFQIPLWQELIKVAHNAHLALPQDHTYVAFDFALTEKGWIIIEGNWGDFVVQQTSLHRGLRQDFIDLLVGTYKCNYSINQYD